MNLPLPPKLTVSTEDFEASLRRASTLLLKQLEDGPESIMPMLEVDALSSKGERLKYLMALSVPFNEAVDKRTILSQIGQKLHRDMQIPLCVILISEAWVASQNDCGLEPRHSPDRREAIIISGMTVDNRTGTITIPVRRDHLNKMIACGAPTEIVKSESALLKQVYSAFVAEALKTIVPPPNPITLPETKEAVHPLFTRYEPDPVGMALNTGYNLFDTTTGMSGLAKWKDTSLDILALHTREPGRGQFREFLRQAREHFTTIRIWEVWNERFERHLEANGFRREQEIEDGETLTGWRWDKPPSQI